MLFDNYIKYFKIVIYIWSFKIFINGNGGKMNNASHRLLFFALPNHTACAHHYHSYYFNAYGGEMKERSINVRVGKYGFYFIEPQANSNAKDLANKLVWLDGVIEVQLTSGEAGYIVVAKKDSNYALENFIKRNALKSRYIESHYVLSKR